MQLLFIYTIIIWVVSIIEYSPSMINVKWISRGWVVILGTYTLRDWIDWNREFRHRFKRGELNCPSTSRRPDLITNCGGAIARFNNLPRKLTNPSIFKGICHVAESSDNVIVKLVKKIKRKFSAIPFVCQRTFPSDNRAEHLSMDHIYLSFFDYHWCSWFLMPSIFSLWLVGGPRTGGAFGILKMRLGEWLGLIKKDSHETAEKTLFNLVLNTSLAAWIADIKEQDDGSVISKLLVPNATHVFTDMTVTSGDFQLTIDLTKRKINKAYFDGETLELNDAVTMAFIVLVSHTHPVLHSFANWGINPDAGDHFIRRMAICTIAYNNLGMERVPRVYEAMRKIGLTKYTTSDVMRLILHQGPHTVPPHTHLLRLQKYSKFVKFVLQVRSYFLSEFLSFQEDFQGIDGEAFFIGTVMHSIDHLSVASQVNINNFMGSDEFVADRDIATITLSCFVDRPSFRLFECRFSHAPHPFFRKVYKFASKIDQGLADMMECTISM